MGVKRHETLVLVRERASLQVALRDATPARLMLPQMPSEVLECYLHGSFDAGYSIGFLEVASNPDAVIATGSYRLIHGGSIRITSHSPPGGVADEGGTV